MLEIKDLEVLATKFAREYWGMEYDPDIFPIEIDRYMHRPYGVCEYVVDGDRGMALKIILSANLLKCFDDEGVIDVLKHELCHWALLEKGSTQFRDGDEEFEKELIRIGSGSGDEEPRGRKIKEEVYHSLVCKGCDGMIATYLKKQTAMKWLKRDVVTPCCKKFMTYEKTIY